MTVTTAPPPPTIELEAPPGGRLTVAPRSPDDRLGELADAIGLDPHQPLRLDGRPVGRHETLARAGLVRGSRLAPGERDDPAASVPNGVIAVVGEGGPAAGTTVLLGPGRHVVGRAASAAVPIADPALEPHHGLLEVAADGTVRFVQLTGRVPTRIAGEPVTRGCVVAPNAPLVVGASRLHVGPVLEATVAAPAALTPTPGDPWRRTLRRSPRALPRWAPEPIVVPAPATAPPGPAATGLAAAAFTLAGSVVVALVMGSTMFLVLGAVGGIASFGLWLAARVRAGRDGRRAGRMRERDQITFATAVELQREERWRHHLTVTPTVAAAVTEARSIGGRVWARRAGHPDTFNVTLGWGPLSWDLAVDLGGRGIGLPLEVAAVVEAAERFGDAPVPTELGPGTALAITGPAARAVAWSLIVQLATWTGPADWRLVVIAGEPGDWDWCRWLPHATAPDGAATVLGADDAERAGAVLGRLDVDDGPQRRHVVLVTDRPEILALRTGAVRRFLAGCPSAAVLVAVPPGDAVPAMCNRALEIGSTGLARWQPDGASTTPSGRVHVAGVTAATATRVARRLAALHDPEDPSAAARALPSTLALSRLRERHGAGAIDDAIAIAGAWRSAGPDPAPAAEIGVAADGVVEIDLARDGPHALVAGTTGSGKSELLRTLVVSLAARSSPDHLTFVLVDYKGGATFDSCADLPHTVGVVTDLDERLAARTLVSLEAELRRRERVLRAAGADDLTAYRGTPGRPALPRLVVLIDEFAALAAELPAFLSSLVGVAQRGRSLGVHLVLATQRPSGVVDDDIRANTNLRLALRLQDVADARDVVGDAAPAAFPRGIPGRAMLRLGPDETVVFQAARSSGPRPPREDQRLRVVAAGADEVSSEPSELEVLVRAIRHAATLSDVAPPHRPFLPPLPDLIQSTGQGVDGVDGVTLGPGDAGVVDDPAGQRRRPLRWTPDDGHLAVLGALGSGTTTALRTVLAALATSSSPARLHMYTIDATGDQRLDELVHLPHCGAVVRLHERERLGRLLRRLVDELDSRRRAGGRAGRPRVVLAVDGITALRGSLDGGRGSPDLALFTRLVGEGAAVGLACVITAERPGAVPPALLAACSERWVLRVDDASEAPLAGVPAASAPRAGPGRLVCASNGLEAQLAILEIRPGDLQPGGPAPVETLSPEIDAAHLPPGCRRNGETELVIGIDFASLAPAVLTVPDGEHVLVAGPARSGRTTALVRLVASWRDVHPDGLVHTLSARPETPLAADTPAVSVDAVVTAVADLAPGRACLIVVDDADRLDDASGALSALVAGRRPGLLVVAAGRPDALRTRYGEWTAVVRRSRIGLLLAACADTDGDLLGELLPRHPPLPPRPGLAWLVGGGQRALVQIGRATPGTAGPPTCRVESPTRQTDPAT
jgi:DNA segregation ATPase FtsK/SpoIIIE, S-DNA-T family